MPRKPHRTGLLCRHSVSRLIRGLSAVSLCGLLLGVAAADEPSQPKWTYAPELLRPFWQGDTVEGESVLFIKDEATGVAKASVLFPIQDILAVRNSAGDVTYEQGRDYVWQADSREIVLPAGSRIVSCTPPELRRPAKSQRYELTHRDGNGEIFFGAKLEYADLQSCITYRHAPGLWKPPMPTFDPQALPRTIRRLQDRQLVTIVTLGDSISAGANASALGEAAPFQPAYPELLPLHLQARYQGQVEQKNLSVGGKDTAWALTQVDAIVAAQPHLVIVAFGMNDSAGRSASDYQANTQKLIAQLRERLPETEFILVASMLGNRGWTRLQHDLFPQYRDALAQLCEPGIALADLTSVWTEFLELKQDWDQTGNGVNHPNDFGHRVYAQVISALLVPGTAAPSQPTLHTFERLPLTTEYFAEGAHAGDLNRDGHADVVYGPYWFEGPSFQTKHEIYPPQPQNREGYADHFFAWVHDFNGDGWKDVFAVGFPGTPAHVYENPGAAGHDRHWTKHRVFDSVANESPHLTNLVGDERPELVCSRGGHFGFATVNWEQPFTPWAFHAVSEPLTDKRFGHGLGVGDVNGDGRLDILHSKGWLEQPAAEADTTRWVAHEASFTTAYGGAEMYAYDVDGDGDNDILTSDAAHDFGLVWYEQVRKDGETSFQRHLIMGSHPSENRYGVLFSEPHSLNLADIDGDGLKDLVTGKTYYSHHKQSPLWDAGAVVYWFRLVRGPDGVDWIPYQADGEAGIGRQVSLVDLEGDGLLDIVVGGMKGAHVLRHRKTVVDQATWDKAQPQRYQGPPKPSVAGSSALRGPRSTPDQQTGRVVGAVEAESLKPKTSSGQAQVQQMAGFKTDHWSGDAQLFWSRAKPGDTLELELPDQTGTVDLDVVLTCARDYAIVQLSLDDQPLGKPIDLYESQVLTTGVLTFPKRELKPGPHKLTIQIVGANADAAKAHMVGIDYVRWRSSAE